MEIFLSEIGSLEPGGNAVWWPGIKISEQPQAYLFPISLHSLPSFARFRKKRKIREHSSHHCFHQQRLLDFRPRESFQNHSIKKWSDISSPFILNDNIKYFIAFLDVSSTKHGYQKNTKKIRTPGPVYQLVQVLDLHNTKQIQSVNFVLVGTPKLESGKLCCDQDSLKSLCVQNILNNNFVGNTL